VITTQLGSLPPYQRMVDVVATGRMEEGYVVIDEKNIETGTDLQEE
jgi:hypothetical protein